MASWVSGDITGSAAKAQPDAGTGGPGTLGQDGPIGGTHKTQYTKPFHNVSGAWENIFCIQGRKSSVLRRLGNIFCIQGRRKICPAYDNRGTVYDNRGCGIVVALGKKCHNNKQIPGQVPQCHNTRKAPKDGLQKRGGLYTRVSRQNL